MHLFVPIQEKTMSGVQKRLREIKHAKAYGAELWLDQLEDSSLDHLNFIPLLFAGINSLDRRQIRGARGVSLLAVCKKPLEKGRFKGTYAQMADILIAASAWADYIDVPIRMPLPLIRRIIKNSQLPTPNSQLILSYHNFNSTPSTSYLLKKARRMKALGAHIVKIACHANSMEDTLRIIFLAQQLQKEGIRHILIAMGPLGIASRLLTPLLGGEIMFAPLTRTRSTAKGQLTVGEMRKYLSLLEKGDLEDLQ